MTTALTQSAFAPETGEVWLVLLTISQPSISPSIRVVNNTQSVISRGEEFLPFWFRPVLPDETDDSPARAQIAIDNVSREMAQAIRSISTPPEMLLEVVRASAPDTVELQWPNFFLRNVKWNANQLTGDLTLEDFVDEPYPSGTFTPASFPALY